MGEHPAQVASGFNVLSSQAGEVLYNDAVDLAIGNVLHHFLKRRTVKNDTAVTIVDFFGYDLDVRVSFNKVLNQLPLVGKRCRSRWSDHLCKTDEYKLLPDILA